MFSTGSGRSGVERPPCPGMLGVFTRGLAQGSLACASAAAAWRIGAGTVAAILLRTDLGPALLLVAALLAEIRLTAGPRASLLATALLVVGTAALACLTGFIVLHARLIAAAVTLLAIHRFLLFAIGDFIWQTVCRRCALGIVCPERQNLAMRP